MKFSNSLFVVVYLLISCRAPKSIMVLKDVSLYGKFNSAKGDIRLILNKDSTYNFFMPTAYSKMAEGSGRWSITQNQKILLIDSLLLNQLESNLYAMHSWPPDSLKIYLSNDSKSDFPVIRSYSKEGLELNVFTPVSYVAKAVDSIQVSYLTWGSQVKHLYTKIIKVNHLSGTYKLHIAKPNLANRTIIHDTLEVTINNYGVIKLRYSDTELFKAK